MTFLVTSLIYPQATATLTYLDRIGHWGDCVEELLGVASVLLTARGSEVLRVPNR